MASRSTKNQPKLWSRSLVVLMGINFCSALSFYLIMVKLVQFAMDTYDVAASVAGLAVTAYVISALFARMAFGGKIDIWGVKRSIAIGVTINAIAMLLYLVPMGFVPLLAVRVFHGFGFAITTGSAAAGAALVLPPERYGEGIGYYAMMQALATGIGPFVAIVLTNAFQGYFPMFAFAAGVAVFSVLTVPLLKIPPPKEMVFTLEKPQQHQSSPAPAGDNATTSAGVTIGDAPQPADAMVGGVSSSADAAADGATPHAGAAAGGALSSAHGMLSQKPPRKLRGIEKYVHLPVAPISSVLFLVYLGYAGIISFVAGYAESLGLEDAVSVYFVVYAVVILVSRPIVGRRIDRLGENSTIYICLASLVIGFVVLAFASNALLLLVSAALLGFGIGATQSIIQAVIARDAPIDELGKANSTFFMSMDLGSGIGPVAIGAIIPVAGYSAIYLVLAVVSACAILDYYLVHGRFCSHDARL